jgi:hypothetical protein
VSRWHIGRVARALSRGVCYRRNRLRHLREGFPRDRKDSGSAKQNAE